MLGICMNMSVGLMVALYVGLLSCDGCQAQGFGMSGAPTRSRPQPTTNRVPTVLANEERRWIQSLGRPVDAVLALSFFRGDALRQLRRCVFIAGRSEGKGEPFEWL